MFKIAQLCKIKVWGLNWKFEKKLLLQAIMICETVNNNCATVKGGALLVSFNFTNF
jgi:hypothetical protein